MNTLVLTGATSPRSAPLQTLSAIEGLKKGWCLYHKVPEDSVVLNAEYQRDVKEFVFSFAGTRFDLTMWTFGQLREFILDYMEQRVKSHERLLKSPSLDVITMEKLIGSEVEILERFSVLTRDEAQTFGRHGCSSKSGLIGPPENLAVPAEFFEEGLSRLVTSLKTSARKCVRRWTCKHDHPRRHVSEKDVGPEAFEKIARSIAFAPSRCAGLGWIVLTGKPCYKCGWSDPNGPAR